MFTWGASVAQGEHRDLSTGALVKVFDNEAAMMYAWHAFFDQADPDAIPVFQVSMAPTSLDCTQAIIVFKVLFAPDASHAPIIMPYA